VKWAGSFAQRLRDIRRCPFPIIRTEWIKPATPQPSACRFSLSRSNSFNFKTPLFEYPMATTTNCLICCAPPRPLMPPLIQRSVRRRCRLSLVVSLVQFSSPLTFSFSRTLRSFKPFMPFFNASLTLFSRSICCITIRFSRFLPLLSGLLFYLLSMHVFIPHTLL